MASPTARRPDAGGAAEFEVGPNPFAPSLAAFGRVRFHWREAGGQVVLADWGHHVVRHLEAGVDGDALWDGTDDAGRALPGGVYPFVARLAGKRWRGAITLVR